MKYLIDFTVLAVLYVFVFYKKWRTKSRDVLFVNTTMYIYLSFVLYFTLMPIITSLPFLFDHPYVSMNLEPFIDVTLSRGDFIRQILLNIIMTIPFGFLLPLVSRKLSSFPKVILCTFLLSLFIEVIQPLISISRSSDITDIINNVIGGALGYLAYLIFRPLIVRILNYIKHFPDSSIQE